MMKKALGTYDPTVQMFVEEDHEPDQKHLKFLKFLVERGDLKDDVSID